MRRWNMLHRVVLLQVPQRHETRQPRQIGSSCGHVKEISIGNAPETAITAEATEAAVAMESTGEAA